ncbi:hypothetical protein EZS27_002441 [termite gut metagenome]|uniref:Methyltransferase FkbM domain-containing protein n=1 Tax=termite gut metagenome TaxID=433724 RepID=A0A5J4SYC4_9ZZZZ
MYNLKKLHPVHLEDLVRVGRNYDGGYVLSNQQIEKTEILLSFGINDDWSFEADFLNRKNVELYAFDYSVSSLIFKSKSLHNFAFMLGYLVLLKISKAKVYGRRWYYLSRLSKSFKQFFRKDLQHYFVPKFLGEKDDEKFTRLDTVFKSLPNNIPDLSIFIKMDIEIWEYRTLPQLLPFFNKINGLVIEFHEIDIAEKKFEEIIDLFSDQFDVAHVHANNFGGIIYGTNLPKVLEITFINKNMIPNSTFFSSLSYPIKGLDFPCDETQYDIILVF